MAWNSTREWEQGGAATLVTLDVPGIGWAERNRVLDSAYREYCELRDTGPVHVTEFVERYPSYKKSLRNMIDLHESVESVVDWESFEWPKPGEQHFGFEIVDELGSGGMAYVYLAREIALGGRPVVLKFSVGGDYEADMLGRLSHPGIVPVHSLKVDEVSQLSAVCMPYLGSSTIANLVEQLYGGDGQPTTGAQILEALTSRERCPSFVGQYRKKLPPTSVLRRGTYADAVVEIGMRIADALAFTASRNILHRDLKPSNVLVTPSGQPMLLDFNLSLDVRKRPGRLGGTLPYMSPEQISEVFVRPFEGFYSDPRSDLYALGVILYEMLTGTLPFGDPASEDHDAAAQDYLERQF